ncbi:MAG: Gfo/Idh/MocA family oxidoreductase [candidate division Zixibacteria bacterium]|nr:Gfo/Idh/MocA family oxidoreductase [candidate division Zixibacteria bacterium]
MMDAIRPDAIYFCIPPGVHNGEVIRASRTGIHVFVEKPMSLYYDEAVDMDRAIRETGVVSP